MTDAAMLPTPGAVLDYWFGPTRDDHVAANRQHKLWFTKSDTTDQFIRDRFLDLHAALNAGLADVWANQGARARLAAIIVLDQFSRNMFRGQPAAFASDPLALKLARDGIARGEDSDLSELERSFFYLPFEHSESLMDQDESVALFTRLSADARSVFRPICESSHDYAEQHREIIRTFGRFPHRNAILGRANTAAEAEYLATPGAGF